MLAWDQVNTLRDDIGEDDFQDVVGLFLEEMDDSIARLDAALSPEDMGALLHFLKGSALNLGFQSFADRCADGEAQIRDGAGPVDTAALVKVYRQSRTMFLSGLKMPLDDTG